MTKRKPTQAIRTSALAGWKKAALMLWTILLTVSGITALWEIPRSFQHTPGETWIMFRENPEYVAPAAIVFAAVLLIGGGLVGLIYLIKRSKRMHA